MTKLVATKVSGTQGNYSTLETLDIRLSAIRIVLLVVSGCREMLRSFLSPFKVCKYFLLVKRCT